MSGKSGSWKMKGDIKEVPVPGIARLVPEMSWKVPELARKAP